MASNRFAWGVDIGNRALKAVKLVREDAGLRVDDFDVIEHETVLSESGDNREQLIQTALQTFVSRHAAKGGEVAIGVSGQSSFARFIKLPPVEKNKIPEIVRFEAIQQIPFPLDDVEWSYQLFHDEGSPDVEVGIFAMRKDLVNRQLQFFTDSNLDVGLVQMSPLAVYNAMYYDQRIKGTTMIIDLGAENTDLIIAEGESIWLRSIPIGGNNFTEALVKSFKMKFEKAEELKRNAATSKYGRQILQAMRPVFADLVAEIQRSIGFYASVHRDSRIQKVLALGGTFRLPGLQKYLQQNLQLDVQRIDTIAGGAPADARVAAMFSENLLSSVGAYGLALQSMGDGKINSSLLPLPIRRARMWRGKTKWFGAAAAVFVAGLIGVPVARYFYDDYQLTRAKESHESAIMQVSSKASELDAKWSEISTVGGPEREQITSVTNLLTHRDLWPRLLKDIDSSLPDPGPDVASGEPERIKKVPRAERKQFIVEKVSTVYHSNLNPLLKMTDDELKTQADKGGGTFTPSSSGAAPAPTGMPMYPGGAYPGYPGGGGGAYPGYPGGAGGAYPGYPGGAGGGYPGYPGGGQQSMDASAGAGGEDTGPKKRGFVITLKCNTPYKNYTGIAEEIRMAMLATNPEPTAPQKPYRIERVIAPTLGKIKKEDWLQNVQQSSRVNRPTRGGAGGYPGAGAYPGYPGGAGRGYPGYPAYPGAQARPQQQPAAQKKDDKSGAPARPAAPNARGGALGADQLEDVFVDPLTKESLKDDFTVTLLAVVVLDPEVEKPAEGTAAETPADTTGAGTAQPAADATAVPAAAPIAPPPAATDQAPATEAESPAPAGGAQPAPAPEAEAAPASPAPADAAPAASPEPAAGQPEQAK